MAKVFLGLAIALMIATAVVSFLAKGQIDTVQGNLRDTKNSLTAANASLKRTEGELKVAQEEVATTKTALEAEKAAGEKLKADVEALTAKAEKAQMDVEARMREIEELNKKLAGMPTAPTADPQAAAEAEKLRGDLQKAQTELAESKQVQETLNARVKDAEEKYRAQVDEVERYRKGFAKIGLSGRIMAVNPGWNFVVLSVGDRQGAAVGATMLVMRGGSPIGKAKITSVEPSTSIADIVVGSVPEGYSVQPGDMVVYEGPRK
jgi:septal ring factor EnvC (AmiA/AmiB activator)